MNLKKTAIALAVATVAATPILASADGSVYASARYGFATSDATDLKETHKDYRPKRANQFGDFGSRWGIKGETDLGNGMTAFGHWEAAMFPSVTTSIKIPLDDATATGIDIGANGIKVNDNGTTDKKDDYIEVKGDSDSATRDYKIGVKGNFGMVYMGQGIDHAWDTYMTSDVAWWYGGTQHVTEGIDSNAITYMNDFGVASLAFTAQMSDGGKTDSNSTDGFELAVAFDAGPVNIAIGATDEKAENSAVGLVVKGETGDFNYAVDFQVGETTLAGDSDVGAVSYQVEASAAGFYAQYGVKTHEPSEGDFNTSALVLGYTYNIGPRALMYFEYRDRESFGFATDANDKTTFNVYGDTVFAAVLKYDIL